MNQTTLERRLEAADAHTRVGAMRLQRQHALVARLEREGYETKMARTLLARFEDLHELCLRERDLVRLRLLALRMKLDRLH